MSAVWIRFRAELRARWRAWLGLALLVGIASGAALTFAAGARRTDTSYARFLDEHDAYDVMVVNYREDGTAVFDFDELEQLPQVADAARAGYEYVTFSAANLVSGGGRIGTEMNEFKMLDGRAFDPDEPEMVVSFTLAEEHDVEVGDRIEVVPRALVELLEADDVEAATERFDDITPEAIRATRRFLEQAPAGEVEVVGIEAAPGEFPPQFAFNRPLVHLSPALAPLFDVLGHSALLVRLQGGSDAVDDFLAELEERSDGLPLQVIVQRDHAAAVERSIHFQAVALSLLAGLTAVAGVLILGQLLARLAYLESTDHPTLRALGMGTRERVLLGVLRAATIGGVGAALGATGALVASRWFPTGLARTAEPDPGFDVDLIVVIGGAAITVLVVAVLSLWPAWRAARVTDGARNAVVQESRLTRAVANRHMPVPAAIGARMALEAGRGRAAVPVRTTLAGVTLGIVALTAALTFGASLAHLLDTPRLYGVTWDLEIVTGEGSGIGSEGVEFLRGDERVEAVAVGSANFSEGITVGGRRVDAMVLEAMRGGISPPILTGHAPKTADEIALGARTLRSLDAGIGDTVDVRVPGGDDTVPMTIVGTAVFPTVSEHTQLGQGALVTPTGATMLEPLDADGAGDNAAPEDEFGVILNLRSGVDPDALVEDLAAELELQEDEGETLLPNEGARPTDIVNFGRVERMPFVLGGILAVVAAAALAHLLLSAVLRRRRDLALLKTMGFVRRQVEAVIASQATTVALVGILVGVPVGIAVGRWVWGLMADNLGVVSEPQVPAVALVVIVVGALLLANAIAFVPGRLAARTHPATDLRPE
jgi:ABC-type lipoprotein release transport system permease subunit